MVARAAIGYRGGMSDEPTPPAASTGNAGCGTTAIAIIALLVALGAGNQARNNGRGNQITSTQNDVRRLESKVRELETRITQLEKR